MNESIQRSNNERTNNMNIMVWVKNCGGNSNKKNDTKKK